MRILVNIANLFFRKIASHNLPPWISFRMCSFQLTFANVEYYHLGIFVWIMKNSISVSQGSQWPPKSFLPYFRSRDPYFPLGHMTAQLRASLSQPPAVGFPSVAKLSALWARHGPLTDFGLKISNACFPIFYFPVFELEQEQTCGDIIGNGRATRWKEMGFLSGNVKQSYEAHLRILIHDSREREKWTMFFKPLYFGACLL